MNTLKENYDLVVIGAGPAGTPVAMEYAKLNPNKSVALIDATGKLGGECLFQGCIPSKILEASAHAIKSLNELESFGVTLTDEQYQLAWQKVTQRKVAILDKRSNAAKANALEIKNLDLIQANATFSDKHILELTQDAQNKNITFTKAVIGTGSRSFVPNYSGNGVDKIWTNSDFFAKMELPKSLAIIGTGAIAVELASILSTLGVKVTLFGRSEMILTNIDKEAAAVLHKQLETNPNVELLLNSEIVSVDFAQDSFIIEYIQDNESKKHSFHKVLSAAGRVPNIEHLNLEKAGVKATHKGITISKHLQTSNPDIFANGDVAEGFPKFAHTAVYGAHTLAQNLFLEHNLFSLDYDKNSWVLFTSPNVMMAGLSEKEAKKRNIKVIVDSFDFAIEAKSQIEQEDSGYLKFIVEKKTNCIIGISALHEEAQTMGGEASLIIANRLTLKDIIASIHPHPTSSEAFVMLAKKMMGEIMLEKLKNPIVQGALTIERWL